MINKKYGISAKQVSKYGFKLALEVYEKDNRKCTVCGATERLAIHHIDRSGKSKNPNNSLDNLQLMCIKCHSSMHGKQSMLQRWGKEWEKNDGYLYKDKVAEYMKEYRKKNKKKRKLYWKKYYEKNKEHLLEQRKTYESYYNKPKKSARISQRRLNERNN